MDNTHLDNRHNGAAHARIVEASCICVVSIILIVGLWPFHAPNNNVDWLENANGLHFGRHGSIVSSGAFRNNYLNDNTSCSLEIWLEPSLTDGKNTILSFDGSRHPGAPFSLHQNKDALRIQRHNVDNYGTSRTAWFEVEGIFREKKPVFLTITLGKQDTSVYFDGLLAKVSPIFGASTNNLTGRLVVANSPSANNSWSGQIWGLAVYRRQLTPAQVVQHYESWTKTQRPALAEDEGPVASYLFNEGKGNIVHNQLDSATDLIIPTHYFVLHPGRLVYPWREFEPTWTYWKDVSINIAGFIPLGLCVVAYFSLVRRINCPATTTIVVGFMTSLTIETLQAFLPTRSSGMTDIITNTLGTAIGVMLYRWSFTQILLTKARQYGMDAKLSKDTDSESVMISSNSI